MALFARVLFHLLQTHTNTYAITQVMKHPSSFYPAPSYQLKRSPAQAQGQQEEGKEARSLSLLRLEQVRVAVAMYPAASLLNHSCSANTNLLFRGRTLLISAKEKLPGGTEVLNSYGPRSGRHPWEQRQKELR